MGRALALAALVGCAGRVDDGPKPVHTPTDPTATPTTDLSTPVTDTAAPADSGTSTTTTPTQPGDPLLFDVTGWVYGVDLASGTWVAPIGVGPLIGSALTGTDLLVTATSIGTTDIDLLAALGANGVQERCTETVPLPASSWTDPSFAASASALSMTFLGAAVDLTDVAFSGTFQADGSRIGGAELAGQLDTRTLGALFGLGTGEDAVCVLVASFGVSCHACPDGASYCLDVDVIDLDGPNLPTATLVERTTADIAADPACVN